MGADRRLSVSGLGRDFPGTAPIAAQALALRRVLPASRDHVGDRGPGQGHVVRCRDRVAAARLLHSDAVQHRAGVPGCSNRRAFREIDNLVPYVPRLWLHLSPIIYPVERLDAVPVALRAPCA